MRILLLIIILLISTKSSAYDSYVNNAKPKWVTNIKFKDNVTLRSIIKLEESKIEFMSDLYDQARQKFFVFTGISDDSCFNGRLIISIINECDLDDKEYFPNELDYSEGNLFVLGRYFRDLNMLYVVPPNLSIYYWRKTFAHELLHYFYDDCGIVFRDDDIEHNLIEKFLVVNKKWFY